MHTLVIGLHLRLVTSGAFGITCKMLAYLIIFSSGYILNTVENLCDRNHWGWPSDSSLALDVF